MTLDLRQYDFHRLLKLHLGRVEQRVGLVRAFPSQGRELDNLDPVERPAVGLCGGLQLLFRLRQRDVEPTLAVGHSLQEEMERERRLTSAGNAIDEEDAVSRQTSPQDLIQTGDSNAREGPRIGRGSG